MAKRTAMMLVLLFVVVQAGFMVPTTASAQAPDVVAEMVRQDAMNRTLRTIRNAATTAIATSLINIMTYFANNLAHDAALLVASGGNADEPLFQPFPIEDYFIYAGAEVASQVISQLVADENGRLANFNVCAPPNLPSLRAGIRGNFVRDDLELTLCGDLSDFKNNWVGFFQNVGNSISDPQARTETILNTVARTFDPNVNEFSVSLGLYTETLMASQNAGHYSLLETLSNNGYKDVVNFLTGRVETPASMVESYTEFATTNSIKQGFDIGGYILSNNEALLQVGVSAGSVFTNTLLSKLVERLSDGIFADIGVDPNPFDEFASGGSDRASAAAALRELRTFQPLDATNFNFLGELATCPSNLRGTSRKLYNCVIDTNFATVLSRAKAGDAMTLRRAIEEGMINGGWALIPETQESRDQDPNCYTYGFCHSNLVKLRKARIIPIGWELATQIPQASSGTLTLKQVMDGFNDCNADNQRDGSHPFCHLIDPNWILKMPEASCRILASGQILEAASVATRAEECVDIQSCILEGDNGQCVGGYGYCVREENVWRFRGEQCDANAASCLGFERRDGEQVHYLTTTVDQSGCNEGNAGCAWYQTEKVEQTDGNFVWLPLNNAANAEARPTAFEERIYLTGAVETCNEADGGCTELIPRGDVTLNAVVNPGFENDVDGDGFPDGWFASDYAAIELDQVGAASRGGVRAVNPHGATLFQPGIVLNPGSFYTLSFYARQPGATGAEARVWLALATPSGADVSLANTSFDDTCTRFDSNGNGIPNAMGVNGSPTSTNYERFTCSFTVPPVPGESEVHAFLNVAGGIGALGPGIWVDDVQVENNPSATNWANGYSQNITTLPRTYLKLPPDYLNCTGSPNDPAECADYAKVCSEGDVGCTEYTPTNGDPSVLGIASELDRCDGACSGYDTFKQEPTRYEPAGSFPVYFIPRTADACSADAVGCDEFTNLSTEEVEYFTYLRACVTQTQSAGNESVYYTWEGSDVEGYQLRTWTLLESNIAFTGNYTYPSGFIESNLGNAPCTSWTADENGITCAESLSDVVNHQNVEACDEHSDIFDNPDCREFYDGDGNIHYRDWRDTVTVDNACVSYRKTEVAGLGSDLDGNGIDDGQENCSESGGYFNPANDQCIYYGFSEESEACSDDENGCREYTGGQSRNSRIVLNDNFEGNLSNWMASSASLVTLSNESVATGGHSIKSEGGAAVRTFMFNNGSVCTDPTGCPSGTGVLGGTCVVLNGERTCGTLDNQLFLGKTYTLTFWAKGNGSINVGFDIQTGGAPTIDAAFVTNLLLEPDWKRYSVGPLDMHPDEYPNFGLATTLTFAPAGATEMFLDNIVLREGESNITVIRDSWVTPAMCDENFEGQVSPQFQLGCQEYSDQSGNTHYLKSFSRLCSEDVVGCSAYYDTANSDAVNAQVFNATCNTIDGSVVNAKTSCHLRQSGGVYNTSSPKVCDIAPGLSSCKFDLNMFLPASLIGNATFAHIAYEADTQVVPMDRTVYTVFNAEFTCFAGSAGCQEVGLPTLSPDHSVVQSFESVYFVNDPDEYNEILCGSNGLFCEEYDAGGEGVWYFRDPRGQTCEYKTNITVGGATYDGWFRTGTTNHCYGSGTCSGNAGIACSLDSDCATAGAGTCNITSGSYVIGGTTSGLWRNGDAGYASWVGECSADNDGCSEFLEPLQISDDQFYSNATGEAYYFLDNNALDENTVFASERCDGRVSQRQGCVLFNDTGDTAQTFNTSATLVKSTHADDLLGGQAFDLVDPVDCESGDSTIVLPSGETIDLCAQRCVYRRSALSPGFNPNSASTTADLYRIGGSCMTVSDCTPYESTTGEVVTGTCRDTISDTRGILPTIPVPRLENDTNRILKVNLDRQCSEWLSCSSERQIWDASIGAYRSVCEGIDLCRAQGEGGSSAFCTEWNVDDAAVVLDVNRYASRDVTWYGNEYSGYAIPDMFPIQELSQENISPPGICMRGTDAVGSCSTDADCVTGATCDTSLQPDPDFRLAFDAGSCDEGFGEACSVGYCSSSGLPCSEQAQCGANGGQCVSGQCLAAAGTGASGPEDCAEDEIYRSGTCYTEEGFCGLDGVCGTGTCFQPPAFREGTCYRDRCLLTVQGTTFEADLTESQVCRAYPEENSPFSSDVVTSWTSSTRAISTDGSRVATVPYSTVSGFEEANFCVSGDDCLCSYQKLNSEGGTPAYVALDTPINLSASSEFNGICVGGSIEGALCSTSAQHFCGEGSCKAINKVDTIYGLPGYCLERDTGININGDPELGACVTWLPVDQLQGQTDLYAKFLNAGYVPPDGETAYCSVLWPYANIRASKAEEGTGDNWYGQDLIACTEKNNSILTTSPKAECFNNNENITCPPGHFMIGGAYHQAGDAEDTLARSCDGRGFSTNRECPFMCVPHDSIDLNGETCLDKVLRSSYTSYENAIFEAKTWERSTPWTPDGVEDEYDLIDFYYYSDLSTFTDVAISLNDCWSRGIEVVNDGYFDWDGKTTMYEEFTGTGSPSFPNGQGWRFYEQDVNFYMGCQLSTVVDDGTNEEAAYTDRLLNPKQTYTLQGVSSAYPQFAYSSTTATAPFGSTLSTNPNCFHGDCWPAEVASCTEGTQEAGIRISSPDTLGGTNECTVGNPTFGYNGTDPQARAFVDFFFEWTNTNQNFGPIVGDRAGNDDEVIVANSVTSTPVPFLSVKNLLSQVFARSVSFFQFRDGLQDAEHSGRFEDVPIGEFSAAAVNTFTWDVRRAEGNPPTVRSLNVDRCFGAYCEEGADGQLTLNGQNAGDIAVQGGFIRASLSFFGFADKDQLPLRRVVVDWGDDSVLSGASATDDNFYKNHRGLEANSQNVSICERCATGTATQCEWGMTSDSCDPNHFNYTHNYTCSQTQVETLESCSFNDDGTLQNSPCSSGGQCAFQVRVHLRDNWGWCTGVCDGEVGCYDGDGDIDADGGADQCNYGSLPNASGTWDPWVYYNGVIYVSP